MSGSGRHRIHRTPLGVIASRAFQLERDTFRAEIQRDGEPLPAAPGAIHGTLHAAWEWAESIVQTRYPHDCEAMQCGNVKLAAG